MSSLRVRSITQTPSLFVFLWGIFIIITTILDNSNLNGNSHSYIYSHAKIIDGTEVPLDRYPYHVALVLDSNVNVDVNVDVFVDANDPTNTEQRCGGALIAPTLVITAASCGHLLSSIDVLIRQCVHRQSTALRRDRTERVVHTQHTKCSIIRVVKSFVTVEGTTRRTNLLPPKS